MKSFFLGTLVAVCSTCVWAWDGVVTQVVEGDYLKVKQEESGKTYNVRLYGVDSPALKQRYGVAAREEAKKLVEGKSVSIDEIQVDKKGASLAVVHINDQYSLQAFLVGSGMAWVHDDQCKHILCSKWQAMQTQAQTARRGLWQDNNPVAPWKYDAKSNKSTKKKRKATPRVQKQN